MNDKQPTLHPISMLSTISYALDFSYEGAVEQLEGLLPAIENPHVLDYDTVQRIINVYTDQKKTNSAFEEQFKIGSQPT